MASHRPRGPGDLTPGQSAVSYGWDNRAPMLHDRLMVFEVAIRRSTLVGHRPTDRLRDRRQTAFGFLLQRTSISPFTTGRMAMGV
jgi:hypothetical protein